jgi:hypothetical protein
MLLSRNKCAQAEGEDAIISEAQLFLDCFLRIHYFMESIPLVIRIVIVNMIRGESKNIILKVLIVYRKMKNWDGCSSDMLSY